MTKNTSHFTTDISKKQSSDSGMALVLIFLLIGYFSGNTIYYKIAIPLQIVNMAYPQFFYPFAIIWFGISNILGIVGSKIVLTLVFVLLVTPTGFIRRLLKKDSLQLTKFKNNSKSVLITRNHWFTAADLEKPY